uniref:Uncharacterized protein n=1 Tax=Desulfobacca acetoxidans TaxID=60893 RepID=A0A7C3SJV7_9BACT
MPSYYLSDTNLVAGQYEELALAAPSALDEAQGWTVDKKAAPNFCVYKPDTTRPYGEFVTTEPSAFSQLGYRTANPLSGQYAAGSWTLYGKVKCNTYYAQKGRGKFRLWRSANADGANAVQITPGWQQSAQIGFTAANQYQTFSIAWTAGSAVTLTDEYLFLEIEWSAEVSGGNNAAAVYWVHNEGTAERLETPAFTAIHHLTVSGADQDQTVPTVTLTQTHQLAVGGNEQAQEAPTVSLTVVSQLSVLGSNQAQECPTVNLEQTHQLTIAGNTQAQECPAVILGQLHWLNVSGTAQEQEADALALEQLHRLLVAATEQAQEASLLVLGQESQGHRLEVLGARHGQETGSIRWRSPVPPSRRLRLKIRLFRLIH